MYLGECLVKICLLLFRQHLAFTAKCVRKCSIVKPKSICEANLGWILACYWNGVNSKICFLFSEWEKCVIIEKAVIRKVRNNYKELYYNRTVREGKK